MSQSEFCMIQNIPLSTCDQALHASNLLRCARSWCRQLCYIFASVGFLDIHEGLVSPALNRHLHKALVTNATAASSSAAVTGEHASL